jgi:hypothetical protein
MEGSRLLRLIRIAATAVCLTACVLLVVLWVQSYWRQETISFRGSANSVSTMKGSLIINGGGFTFMVDDDSAIGIKSYSHRKPLAGGRISVSSMYPISHFDYELRGKGWKFPMWLLVAAFAVVAALPWLPWWSTRYSLRTLLIVTTLIATGLGLAGYFARVN